MAAHVLVVATRTAASADLLAALEERAARGPVTFTLVMPAEGPGTAGREATAERLEAVLGHWRDAGIEADAVVGSWDPLEAVLETYRPGRFDEVIVSTLPGSSSRWLRGDLPYRIARATDLPVTHVTAMDMAHPAPHADQIERPDRSALSLLNVMAYKGSKR